MAGLLLKVQLELFMHALAALASDMRWSMRASMHAQHGQHPLRGNKEHLLSKKMKSQQHLHVFSRPGYLGLAEIILPNLSGKVNNALSSSSSGAHHLQSNTLNL